MIRRGGCRHWFTRSPLPHRPGIPSRPAVSHATQRQQPQAKIQPTLANCVFIVSLQDIKPFPYPRLASVQTTTRRTPCHGSRQPTIPSLSQNAPITVTPCPKHARPSSSNQHNIHDAQILTRSTIPDAATPSTPPLYPSLRIANRFPSGPFAQLSKRTVLVSRMWTQNYKL